jgi:multimeric flavodoxin WrbA
MRKIIFINGSPRGKQSGSQFFIEQVQHSLDSVRTHAEVVNIPKQGTNADDLVFQKMIEADGLVFAFPLYVDSLCAGLLDFLNRFVQFASDKPAHKGSKICPVYAVVNCGFHKARNNKIALQIMKNFTQKAGCTWGFGIGIGGGEFCKEESPNALYRWFKKPVFHALTKLSKELTNPSGKPGKDLYATTRMPTRLFNFVANKRWLKKINQNKIISGWDSKPYESNTSDPVC